MSENALNAALQRMDFGGEMVGHGFRAMARTVLVERLGYRGPASEREVVNDDTKRRVLDAIEAEDGPAAIAAYLDGHEAYLRAGLGATAAFPAAVALNGIRGSILTHDATTLVVIDGARDGDADCWALAAELLARGETKGGLLKLAVDVMRGTITPPRKRGRPQMLSRDLVICAAINSGRSCGMTPTRNETGGMNETGGTSACDAVARELAARGLQPRTYTSVAAVWGRRERRFGAVRLTHW